MAGALPDDDGNAKRGRRPRAGRGPADRSRVPGDPHHRHAGRYQPGRRHLRRLADGADGSGRRQCRGPARARALRHHRGRRRWPSFARSCRRRGQPLRAPADGRPDLDAILVEAWRRGGARNPTHAGHQGDLHLRRDRRRTAARGRCRRRRAARRRAVRRDETKSPAPQTSATTPRPRPDGMRDVLPAQVRMLVDRPAEGAACRGPCRPRRPQPAATAYRVRRRRPNTAIMNMQQVALLPLYSTVSNEAETSPRNHRRRNSSVSASSRVPPAAR